MTIVVQCSGCRRKFRAPDKAAGKRVACPECATVFQVADAQQPQPARSVRPSGTGSNSPRPTVQEQLEPLRLLEAGKYEQAILGLDNVLTREPQNSKLWFLKGSALRELGRLSEALACLEKATKLAPSSADGWVLKGDVLTKLNRVDEAISSYRRYLTVAPPEDAKYIAEAKGILASLEQTGRTPRDPSQSAEQAKAMAREAHALMQAGEYEQALARYDAALKVLPASEAELACSLWVMRSEPCKKLWKWGDDLECWNKILEIGPSLPERWPTWAPEAWGGKGLALDMLRRHREALACYDKALEMNPSAQYAESVRRNREGVLARLKEEEEEKESR